jgi:hypothetical protein
MSNILRTVRTVSIQGSEGFRSNTSSEYMKGRDNVERKDRPLYSRVDAIAKTNIAAPWGGTILATVLV